MNPEVKGDPFDRQRCIKGFDQVKVAGSRCLVLGVGAVGCAVCFALARIGVRRMTIVDFDTVETSNLNRQILYNVPDVGQRKVDAAAAALNAHHNIGASECVLEDVRPTEVVPIHMDVVKNWDRVVQLAKDHDVIFDCVDVGAAYDYAVFSLARLLGIPCVSGSSYIWQYIVEYFDGSRDGSSLSLTGIDKEITDKLDGDTLLTFKDLTFVGKDSKPDTRTLGSSLFVAVPVGLDMVGQWVRHISGGEAVNYVIRQVDKPALPNTVF